MMVFDASSIYACLKQGRPELLRNNYSVILARYEIGNVLWKEAVLHKTFSLSEAEKLVAFFDKLMEEMTLLHPESDKVFKAAVNFHVSYYDASYIYAAQHTDSSLITEDIKLRQKAASKIKVCSAAEIINGH
jgi:predicted nucleic acid-binding protein